MISVDGIVLPDSLVWEDRHVSQRVQQSVLTTLGGKRKVVVRSLVSGFPITLAGGETYGNIQLSTVEALMPLANTPGHIMTLQIGANTWQVVFRHDEPPAFSAIPQVPRVGEQSSDWYIPTLKFLTV